MNEAHERPPEKVCDVDDCNAWKSGEYDYCHHHKGLQDGQAEEGNQRATKHGLYAVPEYLKAHFTESQEDRYVAYFEALCTRYEHRLGNEPDAFAKDRLSRVAIECVKERIADEWLAEQGEATGNLLIEQAIIGQDEEGRPISVEQSNGILKELTALKRETRLTLKDMGLLHDPDSRQAAATEAALAEILSEDE
jgi:hypothetical protein